MGKIFPLSQKPSCFEATIKLIERSFQYQKPHSFETDFAPLMDSSNHHNCFIYLDENENVIAHIGTKDRILSLNGKNFFLTLLGGIAVDEARRGEGIFQELFQDVLAEKRSDASCFILWSDQEKLYRKFGFHLCGSQFQSESPRGESHYVKTSYGTLLENERHEVRELYERSFQRHYLTLERSSDDWELVRKITSADLFIHKKAGKIESYYFQNKGQDLAGIIYEYGTKHDWQTFLNEIAEFGTLWTGANLLEGQESQFQFFLAPGDLRLFSDLIFELTNKKFAIRNINLMKQEVFFDFNDETVSVELPEFLRGVFGPGVFEEIEVKPLFISGLDSI